ncbi:MAG: carbon dioxide-concentrating mechanism protein [Xenococcaceae cyanobacterium]
MSRLDLRRNIQTRQIDTQQQYRFKDSALGLVSTIGFPALVGTADMMLKSAQVIMVGYEKIGSGHCTAVIRGNIADVRLAVEEGAKVAEKFGQLISKLVIARPMPNLEAIFPIGSHLVELHQSRRGYSRLSNQSVGLLETRGFPALVGAADAMLKSAEVQLASYEKIGDGLCTAIIRGSVANVAVAIEVGMQEAERIGEFHSLMVVPRVLEDLENVLPVASCWLDEPEPLPILLPTTIEEKEKEVIALPQADVKPLQIERRVKEIEEL